MNERRIEPRTPMWAFADVFWQNEAGTLCVTRGTLEDTSRSGARVRVDRAIKVGSKVTVKWHREQFSAITKNIRSEGRQFLLGLRREGDPLPPDGSEPATPEADFVVPESLKAAPLPAAAPVTPLAKLAELEPVSTMPIAAASLTRAMRILAAPEVTTPPSSTAGETVARVIRSEPAAPDAGVHASVQPDSSKPGPAPLDQIPVDLTRPDPAGTKVASPEPNGSNLATPEAGSPKALESGALTPGPSQVQSKDGHEGKIMASKSLFSWFSRRQEGVDAADKTQEKEKQSSGTSNAITSRPPISNGPTIGPKGELLSCDDIYRAAGILGSRSGYEIGKVVEMLHSDRLGTLADDARRSLVLLAIEAAGTSPDELLREATERERAINAYEANQRRHMEEYEARKTRENAQIEAEMARVTAHYAERIKANLDQVAREKEALRKWQLSKQNENQRMAEVMELCAKREAPELHVSAMAANAGSSSGRAAISASGPTPVPRATSSRPN